MNGKIISGLGVSGVFLCGWFAGAFFGGRPAEERPGGAAVQSVSVGEVARRTVNPVAWYVGHVEPMQEVDILPQIDGYLEAVKFREGDLVGEGDVLFVIDDERYVAADRQARAALAQGRPAGPRSALPNARGSLWYNTGNEGDVQTQVGVQADGRPARGH